MKRMMISLICMALIFLCASTLWADQEMQDVVYLKNGSVIRGVIIEQVPNQYLKIQTNDGSVFVYNDDEIDKITKEAPILKMQSGGKKSPALAFGLSFIIFPGAGQFYNGESGKGAIQLALAGTGVIVAVNGIANANAPITEMGLLLWLGSSTWSWIDAPLSASRINRERGYSQIIIPGRRAPALSLSSIDMHTGAFEPRITMTWRF
jgi:hypothetical protein